MKITPIQALIPKKDVVTDINTFFKSVKEEFTTGLKDTFFDLQDSKNYYLYQIKGEDSSSIGLVCQIDRTSILDNKILKHEQIIKEKSELLQGFIKQSGAMTKPIMTFHQNDEFLLQKYHEIIHGSAPIFQIKIGEEHHEIYKITDPITINAIESRFESIIPDAFIADGHHRFDSMQNILEENENIEGIVVVLFGANQIKVEPYNKLILGLSMAESDALKAQFDKIGKLTALTSMSLPKNPHEITLLLGNQAFLLELTADILKKYQVHKLPIIDLEILSKEIFSSVLGLEMDDQKIMHLNKSQTLDFIAAPNEIGTCLFCFYPVDILDIIKVSRMGMVLPPKSTWFEPKVRSGIIVGNFHE